MAVTKEKRPRASNGRFVKRTHRPRAQGSTQGEQSLRQASVVRHSPSLQREGSVRLALLTLAILFAAIGFALSFFWIAALVLMGVLWGAMIAERPQRNATVKGLVTEMVTAVVDEAKDVGAAAPGSDSVAGARAVPEDDDVTETAE
jgi:hypothetical protein